MEFNPIDQKVREYLVNHPNLASRSPGLRMSKAGECPRMLDYDLIRGLKPLDYYSALRMMRGTWLHPMWQSIMKEIFGDDFVGCEEEIFWDIEVEGQVHRIPGHPDGSFASMDCVYELKSVSRNTFDLLQGQDHPLPSHIEQGNGYAHVLKRRAVLFHYYCPDNGESLYYEVPYNQELATRTEQKFRARIINQRLGVIQERPYVDQTEAPCFYCSWKTECYEGFVDEVKRMDRAELDKETDKELYEMCVQADKSRFNRLLMEKMEESSRSKSAEFMLAKKLNAALIGEYEVFITVGKKGNPSATIRKPKETGK